MLAHEFSSTDTTAWPPHGTADAVLATTDAASPSIRSELLRPAAHQTSGVALYRSPTVRRVVAVLLGLYGVAVLVIVGWPTPVDARSRGLLFAVLRELHEHGIPEFIGYGTVEFAANVVMFAPLGLFIALLFGPRWWWAAIIVCAALSASIEFYQDLALPDRYGTVRDVVANSTGGLAGACLATAPIAWLRRASPPDSVTQDHFTSV